MKRISAFIVSVVLYAASLQAATFTEGLTSLTYIDTAASSITSSSIDTTNNLVSLPYQQFTDLVDSATLTSDGITTLQAYLKNGASTVNVLSAAWNDTLKYWLIGGSIGDAINLKTSKILKYDGTKYTQMQDDLYDLNGCYANVVASIGNYFLVGGGSARVLVRYPDYRSMGAFVTGTSLAAAGNDPSGYIFKSIAYNGTKALIGCGNGVVGRFDGVTFPVEDLSLAAGFYDQAVPGNCQVIYAIAANSSYSLVGGGYTPTTPWPGRLKKFDGTTWTDLTRSVGDDHYLNIDAETVRSIAWNGSYWLIGCTGGKLKKYDGNLFSDLTPALIGGAGFGSSDIISTIYYNGTDWFIGSNLGNLAKYDGAGSAAVNFKNVKTLLAATWGAASINSIGGNTDHMLFCGNSARLNRSNGLYYSPSSMYITSKKVSLSTDRIYKATISAGEQLNNGTIAYYLSADGGTTWQAMANGVEGNITASGNDLRWKAVLSGKYSTPKLVAPLTINYSTCDASVMPASVGGTVVLASDTLTKLDVAAGTSNLDIQYLIAKDPAPPVSASAPSTALTAFDITAKNYLTGDSVTSFSKPITVTLHYTNGSPTVVDGTSIALANANTSLCLAFWNGLYWVPLTSTVSVAGQSILVSAKVAHFSKYAIVVNSPTDIVSRAQPNPFTPLGTNPLYNQVTVTFANVGAADVELKIWDINGQLIKNLSGAGVTAVSWDGKDNNGKYAESGIYIYEIKVGGIQKTRGSVALAR
ncbi:MAG: FlgD immunoglobulin-like domain containing protein [Candidatus Firestonebacteria bacterium]